MRLWHKDLIPVLPKQQLLGQWRECCCIARNIAVNGTPNHLLVNKIMDYPPEHFNRFAGIVRDEMLHRGYNCDYNKFLQYRMFCGHQISHDDLFAGWHNDRYLLQCFCNLQEKYDCGGITDEEWTLIYNEVEGEIYG